MNTKNTAVFFTLFMFQLLNNLVFAQNAELLKEISPYEGSNPSNFTLFKDKIYFSAAEKVDFRDFSTALWVTDGTSAGTTRVKACNPSMRFSTQPFITTQDFMFFIGRDGTNGQELWASDGTVAGTRMVKNLNPTGDSRFEELIAFKGKLYFSANDGTNDALWVSDGTTNGTYKIRDFPHPNFAYTVPTAFVLFDDRLFFHFDDANSYSQFWETDGTTAGTKRLNTGQDFHSPAQDFKKYKNKIVFRTGGDIKVLTKDSIITIGKIGGGDCLVVENQIAVFKDTLYFQGENNTLYYSDGTLEGTKPIVSTLFLCRFLETNSKLYFVASKLSPIQLWTTNGTTAGTKAVAQNSTYYISDQASSIFVYKNKIYFSAYRSPSIRSQLFVYDPVSDTVEPFISAEPNDFYAFSYFMINNRLYFKGANLNQTNEPGPTSPLALWQTDGTLPGTSSVSPLNINNGARNYDYLFNTKGYLFFANTDNSYWYTDGIQQNTQLIRPKGVETYLANQEKNYILFKDYFIFRGNFSGESNNEELWVLKLNNLTTSTQIPQHDELSTIKLYPNPAQNTVQINDTHLRGTYDLQLYNVLGHKVASFSGVKSHQSLPIARLGSGVYWVKIGNGQREWTTRKMVITR